MLCSVGWARITLRGTQIVAVSVGVVDVTAFSDIGARCHALQEQLERMLDAYKPCHCFVEAFFTKTYMKNGRAVAIDPSLAYSLRAAILITMHCAGVASTLVPPAQWQTAVKKLHTAAVRDGSRRGEGCKAHVLDAIESFLHAPFPTAIPTAAGSTSCADRVHDSSDACGIAVWGALQQHDTVSVVDRLTIETPLVSTHRKTTHPLVSLHRSSHATALSDGTAPPETKPRVVALHPVAVGSETKPPKPSKASGLVPITLLDGRVFQMKTLGQVASVMELYDEWRSGRNGMPALSEVLTTQPNFYLPVRKPGMQSWKRQVSERRLIVKAIELRGVDAIQALFDSGNRWEGLVMALRATP